MTADADLRKAAADIMTMGVSVTDVVTRLAKPTPPGDIKQRQGPGGRMLDYIDARTVMDALDDGVGPDNWQSKHTMEGAKVSCSIGIRIDGEWIWKSDGAGETDIEGEKGSFSDAFKRAAVSWGIGRDLYGNDRPAAAPVSRPPALPVQPLYDGYEGQDDDVRPTRPAQPRAAVSDGDGRCPEHDLAWALKPAGVSKSTNKPYDAFYTCAFKPGRGEPFCQQKPPKAWLARQEV